jgi:O-succinylhomoserine sulfhydrylase
LILIDNCFATLFTATYKMGAHLVVHSATKLMDGQGRVLGGVTVGEPELIKKYIYFPDLRTFLITFNAWVYQKFRDFSDSFRQAL